MRVLVTGATGFLGSHVVDALIAHGHAVVGAVRYPKRGSFLSQEAQFISCDFQSDMSMDVWLPRLKGVDVVVNAVGIITESHSGSFRQIHVDAPKALFDACKSLQIKKIIHISALGVIPEVKTDYGKTKLESENYVLQLGVPAVVLRPAWVYGTRSASFDLLCAFSALPMIPIVDDGRYAIQPTAIEDIAKGVVWLIAHNDLDGQILEAGGPDYLPIRAVHDRLRVWLGKGKAPHLSMPSWFVKWFVKLGDYIFKGPINTASFDMLTRHNITDDQRLWHASKIVPRSLNQGLMDRPATEADVWHSALFFVIPFLRYCLAFLWILTPIITLWGASGTVTYRLFSELGMKEGLIPWMLYATAGMDFLLGLTLLFNYRLGLFGGVQIGVMILYTLIIGGLAPHWLFHPYGPLLKNLPLIAATCVVMAVAPSGKQ